MSARRHWAYLKAVLRHKWYVALACKKLRVPLLVKDDGTVKPLPMPNLYINEMLADWMGAGRAYAPAGTWSIQSTLDWYRKNKDKMQLHPDTRFHVERKLALLSRTRREDL
jgi:hypothetical protein